MQLWSFYCPRQLPMYQKKIKSWTDKITWKILKNLKAVALPSERFCYALCTWYYAFSSYKVSRPNNIFFFKNWFQKYDSSIFGRRVSGITPVFRNPEMSGWADTSTSAAIQSEICRFESVHPNIYAVYELLQEKDQF